MKRPPFAGGSAVALVGVGALFVGLTTALLTVHHSFSTDEVDYLTRVTPANPQLLWNASRAWGVPTLVAPAALFSPSEAVIRVYMTMLLAAGIVGAFWTWRTIVHPFVAPLAGLLFATVFTTTAYGDAVMPNLPVAIAAIAATGLLARLPRTRRRRLVLAGVAAAFAALALLRPTDSLLISLPALVCVAAFRDRRRLDTVVALVAGEVVGWLPWVIEAYISFGGPVARWKAAGDHGIHGLHIGLSLFDIYPRTFGQVGTYCCFGAPASTAGPATTANVAWFIAIPILALLGLVMAVRGRRLADLAPPIVAAGAFIVFYFVLLSYGSPRYLLPILALLSIPVAYGLVSVVTETPPSLRLVAALGCLLVVVADLTLQARLDMTKRAGIIDGSQRQRQHILALDAYLPRGRPCLVMARKPQVTGYYLRCHVAFPGDLTRRKPPQPVQEAKQRHWAILVFSTRGHMPSSSFLATWRRETVLPDGRHPLYAFIPPFQPKPVVRA